MHSSLHMLGKCCYTEGFIKLFIVVTTPIIKVNISMKFSNSILGCGYTQMNIINHRWPSLDQVTQVATNMHSKFSLTCWIFSVASQHQSQEGGQKGLTALWGANIHTKTEDPSIWMQKQRLRSTVMLLRNSKVVNHRTNLYNIGLFKCSRELQNKYSSRSLSHNLKMNEGWRNH